jgi:hypothetical protein
LTLPDWFGIGWVCPYQLSDFLGLICWDRVCSDDKLSWIFFLLLSGNKRSKNAFPGRRLPAREAGIGQMGLPALKNFSPLVL